MGVVCVCLALYFAIQWWVLAFLAAVGRRNPKAQTVVSQEAIQFICLIPAYKYGNVALQSIQAIRNANYPAELIKILVIADNIDDSSQVDALQELADICVVSRLEKPSKTAAIHLALPYLDTFSKDSFVVLLDVDNQPDIQAFQETANSISASKSRSAIWQWQRVGFQPNTSIEYWDSWTEHYNNIVFRQAAQRLDLPVALIGSGMVMQIVDFQEALGTISSMGGFDKILEMQWIRSNRSIHYVPSAIVYDDKVSDLAVLSKQRQRWVAAQFKFFQSYIPKFVRQTKPIRAQVFKLWQYHLLPRPILAAFPVLIAMMSFSGYLYGVLAWQNQFALATVLALSASFATLLSFVLGSTSSIPFIVVIQKLLPLLPKVMYGYGRSLLGLKKANSEFYATPHKPKS